ncbi:hypothetical protein ACTHPB_26415 [Priestia megaterium]|uniref:hypothetical protein n=1 Tax=Priestia megaterium TaxID=1404 RepID=UPI003F7EBBB4
MSTEDKKKSVNTRNVYEGSEKRSLRFEKPPQTQLEKLDEVLGLVKEKNEGDAKE